MVTEFHPSLTWLADCNTHPSVVSGQAQSLSVGFYLIKYLSKNTVDLSSSLTVFFDVWRNPHKYGASRQERQGIHDKASTALLTNFGEHFDSVHRYPSQASNSGSAVRLAQHFLQRAAIKMVQSEQVADTQASLHCIGCTAEACSHNFVFVNPWAHLAATYQLCRSEGLDSSQAEDDEECAAADTWDEHLEQATSAAAEDADSANAALGKQLSEAGDCSAEHSSPHGGTLPLSGEEHTFARGDPVLFFDRDSAAASMSLRVSSSMLPECIPGVEHSVKKFPFKVSKCAEFVAQPPRIFNSP